jgi:riboflavin kinase/FMN adenylyltransferase
MTIGLGDRTANIDDLLVLGNDRFEVEQISVQEINDLSISSTKIRKAISEEICLWQ